jgi:SAM-dependent methyltransferase
LARGGLLGSDDAAVTDAWNERAEAYRTSVTHREGDDLDALVEWCEPGPGVTALDVATGGGHVGRRLAEAGCDVTTCDAAAGMQPDVVCPAEALAFADRSFDVVACRIAAHHFMDVARAVGEMARVAGRVVVIEDTLYASERVEEAERLRDPTHVRSYTEAEWRGFLAAAGLDVDRVGHFPKRHPLEPWLARVGCAGETAARVRELLADRMAPDEPVWLDTKILLRGRIV